MLFKLAIILETRVDYLCISISLFAIDLVFIYSFNQNLYFGRNSKEDNLRKKVARKINPRKESNVVKWICFGLSQNQTKYSIIVL